MKSCNVCSSLNNNESKLYLLFNNPPDGNPELWRLNLCLTCTEKYSAGEILYIINRNMIISLEFNKEPLIAVKPFYAIIGKSEERMVKPKRFVQIGNRLFDTAFPVIRRKEEVKRWRKLSVKDLRREIQITARNFHCSEELLFIFILNYFYINLKILIKL